MADTVLITGGAGFIGSHVGSELLAHGYRVHALDDLVDAFLRTVERIDAVRGRSFNVGGDPVNAVSLLELLDRIEGLCGDRPRCTFEPARTGDQRYYVSDFRKLQRAVEWTPRVSLEHGLRRLHRWLKEGDSEAEPRSVSSEAG